MFDIAAVSESMSYRRDRLSSRSTHSSRIVKEMVGQLGSDKVLNKSSPARRHLCHVSFSLVLEVSSASLHNSDLQ
jgi:hypothetical protein